MAAQGDYTLLEISGDSQIGPRGRHEAVRQRRRTARRACVEARSELFQAGEVGIVAVLAEIDVGERVQEVR
jgi:hypothetical protein